MKIVELVQGSPDWLAWRHTGVGASDLPSIMGISPHKDATRDDVLREKITQIGREASFAMRRGNRLEPVARLAYQEERPCQVRVCCVQHELYPWALASLDGLCLDHHGEVWILELKCQKWEIHEDVLTGLVPPHHQPQVQWQLFCAGLNKLDYVSYSENNRFARKDRLAIVGVERDESLIGLFVNAAAQFWMKVLDGRAA